MASGRVREADAALDAFRPVVPEPGAISLDAMKVMTWRAETALTRHDVEVAVELAAQVRQELSASTARDYLKGLEAHATLIAGRANLLLSRPSEALPLLQRTIELRESILDPTSPALAEAQVALANCYLDLGDSGRANALAARTGKIISSHHQLSGQYTGPQQRLELRLRHVSARPHPPSG
jgi:hypothetical protein